MDTTTQQHISTDRNSDRTAPTTRAPLPGGAERAGRYERWIFPRVLDLIMDTAATRDARARVCAALRGDVVEIGFGTGLNLAHLPAAVTSVRAVEPSLRAVGRAAGRIGTAAVPVDLVGLDGQSLPFADGSVDHVLMTWSLCTIPDSLAAAREIRRILSPGGTLHFVEHGRADDPRVRRWQDRLNPIQRRWACGCNLNRDIPSILEQADLEITRLDTYIADGEPRFLGFTYEGTCRPSRRRRI